MRVLVEAQADVNSVNNKVTGFDIRALTIEM